MQIKRLRAVKALGVGFTVGISTLTVAHANADWPPTLALDHTLIQTSLLTRHFSPDPEHIEQQNLISIELHNPERWLAGSAWFKNSYDQPTWYFYAGREFPLGKLNDELHLRAKLTAGALRGYKDEYRDKIPFNRYGVAPAALPSIGLQWRALEMDLIVFGTAGAMITAGARF